MQAVCFVLCMELIYDAARFISDKVTVLHQAKGPEDVEEKHSKPLLHVWEVRHHPCLVYLMKAGKAQYDYDIYIYIYISMVVFV